MAQAEPEPEQPDQGKTDKDNSDKDNSDKDNSDKDNSDKDNSDKDNSGGKNDKDGEDHDSGDDRGGNVLDLIVNLFTPTRAGRQSSPPRLPQALLPRPDLRQAGRETETAKRESEAFWHRDGRNEVRKESWQYLPHPRAVHRSLTGRRNP